MNQFEDFFYNKPHNRMHKWAHYFEIYEQNFSKFKNKNIKFLEIGVWKGGSIQMWQDYFGKDSLFIGIDVDQKCKEYESDNVKIEIGNQNDQDFLLEVINKYGPVDIIFDDGSHICKDQIQSLNTLFPNMLADDGVYLIEDCHTSYHDFFNLDYKSGYNLANYCKSLVDEMYSYYLPGQNITYWSNHLKSISFYDSVIAIHKKKRENTPYDLEIFNGDILGDGIFRKGMNESSIKKKDNIIESEDI